MEPEFQIEQGAIFMISLDFASHLNGAYRALRELKPKFLREVFVEEARRDDPSVDTWHLGEQYVEWLIKRRYVERADRYTLWLSGSFVETSERLERPEK